MWVKLGTTTNSVPAKLGDTFNPTADSAFMQAQGWRTIADGTPMPTPPHETDTLKSWTYEQDPEDATKAIIVCVWQTEEERQAAKDPNLKDLENLYVQFLAAEWTPILRTKGLIAADASVTVDNTSETQNVTYLLTIKAMGDLDSYSYYSNEFTKYKFMIEGKGGTMDDIVYHAD